MAIDTQKANELIIAIHKKYPDDKIAEIAQSVALRDRLDTIDHATKNYQVHQNTELGSKMIKLWGFV